MISRYLAPLILFSLGLSASPAMAVAESGKELTIEEFLQQLSTVQGVVERKDPFAELDPPFQANQDSNASMDEDAPNMNAPPLERFPASSYEVVAVLLGDKYPRALVRVPDSAAGGGKKVVIVKEGDKLGNHKGVISKIQIEGLVIQQAHKSAHGFVDRSELLLKVGAKAGDQKPQLTVNPANGGRTSN